MSDVRVNLTLHGGDQVNLEKTRSERKVAEVGVTFALKSLTSKERKSMSLMRDRMKSLEDNRKCLVSRCGSDRQSLDDNQRQFLDFGEAAPEPDGDKHTRHDE